MSVLQALDLLTADLGQKYATFSKSPNMCFMFQVPDLVKADLDGWPRHIAQF